MSPNETQEDPAYRVIIDESKKKSIKVQCIGMYCVDSMYVTHDLQRYGRDNESWDCWGSSRNGSLNNIKTKSVGGR